MKLPNSVHNNERADRTDASTSNHTTPPYNTRHSNAEQINDDIQKKDLELKIANNDPSITFCVK